MHMVKVFHNRKAMAQHIAKLMLKDDEYDDDEDDDPVDIYRR
jgi:hypothetical protein